MSGVVGADSAGHVVHVRGVRGGAHLVRHEVLLLADEVHREVRTRSPAGELRAAIAVIALESNPPESSVHLGTSATSWRRTMSSSSSRTRAIVVSWSSVCSRVGPASSSVRVRSPGGRP
jgi:hypothetical protein